MSFSLLPKAMTRKITDLSPEYLRGGGVKLLMMDFDNTVVPYTTSTPSKQFLEWLGEMKKSGISLCVVSNSKKERVVVFCRKYKIDCITHSRKPFSKGIRECLERYDLPAGECALVGDQIYTDVLGANCCGVQSILVKSIHNHTVWLKARHLLEKPFIWAAGKRKI